MPTPAERQALVFFAAVAALGIGVNAWRAARGGDAVIAGSPAELAAQIARVDSAVASSPSRELRRKTKGPSAAVRSRATRPSSPTKPSSGVAPPSAAYFRPPPTAGPLDMDRAEIPAIESLPRIGPALARRIVANRDSFGAFGSLEGLQRVPGIGPAIAKRLRDSVFFSGVPRPGAPTAAVKGRRPRTAP